jgi:hypothetical protein
VSFTIYGFRLRGDSEIRYVGMTSRAADTRLRCLTNEARLYGRRPTTGLGGWLLDNEGRIDAFEIVQVATQAEARIAERTAAAALVQAGHALFNRWLVPKDKRIDWIAPRELRAA